MAGSGAGQQKSSKSFSDLLLSLAAGDGWYSVLKVRVRLAYEQFYKFEAAIFS